MTQFKIYEHNYNVYKNNDKKSLKCLIALQSLHHRPLNTATLLGHRPSHITTLPGHCRSYPATLSGHRSSHAVIFLGRRLSHTATLSLSVACRHAHPHTPWLLVTHNLCFASRDIITAIQGRANPRVNSLITSSPPPSNHCPRTTVVRQRTNRATV